MAAHENLLVGVIEGFYGQPWSQAERFQLFDWMSEWRLNTYVYAPKDDLKHRAIWRELYSAAEREQVRDLIQRCKERNLAFVYSISPGLDIRYSDESDVQHLQKRIEELAALGCQDFALLFDDIPDRMDGRDLKRWGSLASAQSQVANSLFRRSRALNPASRLLFCPTAYCGRMAAQKLGGEGYLQTLGAELLPEILVFWTGPEIVSQEITVPHIKEWQTILRRKPLIWDNLHANDYDGRRFYCGPYAGRPTELKKEVSGLLSNPNNEFPLNYVPLRTLAEFVRSENGWDAREAYFAAMQEWLPRFATIRTQPTFQELIEFGDCYYLPHEEGPKGETIYESAKSLMKLNRAGWDAEAVIAFKQQIVVLRDFCARMAELRDRPLFYALSRRVWELREELDLLLRCLEEKSKGNPCSSGFHLFGTYRGGLVAKLQRLLVQNHDGTFTIP